MLVCSVQALLAVPMPGGPVRFGVPLPAEAVAQGLRLCGPGRLQWRRLPIGGPDADPVWVEIAIVGAPGVARIAADGLPPSADGRGAAFVRETDATDGPAGRVVTTRWRWCDGSLDERTCTTFHAPTTIAGEAYAAGEARTVWNNPPARRCEVVLHLPRRLFERALVMPPAGRLGEPVRRELAAARPHLRELPGERGAGDFGRSGGVVTNLEFDTILGLLHQALGAGDGAALALAMRCAQHLRDRDLDAATGLPFPHGLDHRTGGPAAGHAWLQGLLLAGLLAADDEHLATASVIAHGLAAHPPVGEGRHEVARDFAWPLLELEAWLALTPDRLLAQAADRLAVSIDSRFDPVARTWRFGEGEVGDGVYLERGWITAGLVVPALRRHLLRRADPVLAAHVRTVQSALLEQIGRGRGGLPTHWRTAAGRPFAEHRAAHAPEAILMLEAFDLAELRRLLRREELRTSLAEVLVADDPDLPTTWSIVARCGWVWR